MTLWLWTSQICCDFTNAPSSFCLLRVLVYMYVVPTVGVFVLRSAHSWKRCRLASLKFGQFCKVHKLFASLFECKLPAWMCGFDISIVFCVSSCFKCSRRSSILDTSLTSVHCTPLNVWTTLFFFWTWNRYFKFNNSYFFVLQFCLFYSERVLS